MFNRHILITVALPESPDDEMVICNQSLHQTIDIAKSYTKEHPIKADVVLTNLAEPAIELIKTDNLFTVRAGYAGFSYQTDYIDDYFKLPILFRGTIVEAETKQWGNDRPTTIAAHDGGTGLKKIEVHQDFPENTPARDYVKALFNPKTNAYIDGKANLGDQFDKYYLTLSSDIDTVIDEAVPATDVYLRGKQCAGIWADYVKAITTKYKLQFCVENHIIKLWPESKPFGGTLIVKPEFGLIGLPSVGDSGDVTCEMLLRPDVYLSQPFEIQNSTITGTFNIAQIFHEYDGNKFTTKIISEQTKKKTTDNKATEE